VSKNDRGRMYFRLAVSWNLHMDEKLPMAILSEKFFTRYRSRPRIPKWLLYSNTSSTVFGEMWAFPSRFIPPEAYTNCRYHSGLYNRSVTRIKGNPKSSSSDFSMASTIESGFSSLEARVGDLIRIPMLLQR